MTGGITVDPDGFGAKFAVAEDALWLAGYEVINPANNHIRGGGWLDYMRLSVEQIARCDGIAILPGWERGRGTWVEVTLARGLELPVKPVEEWVAESDR